MAEFTIQKASNDLYYFRLRANNGQVLLASEGYSSKAGCLNGVNAVRSIGKVDDRYERKTSTNGKYYFRLKASNGQIIGTSEMYEVVTARDNAISTVQSMVTDAMVNDEAVQELINLVKEKRKQLGLTEHQLS